VTYIDLERREGRRVGGGGDSDSRKFVSTPFIALFLGFSQLEYTELYIIN
jgi:hypothetical protein